MLRLTEIKLPIDHPEGAIKAAILKRLGIKAEELVGYSIARRGHDARKPEAILFVYTLDVEVKNEPGILKRQKKDQHLSLTPDTSYRFVAQAPANLASRPVVIGTGPAGLFAGLILAQMGFRPIILERGKAVRERAKDTFSLWRRRQARSGIQRAVRRRRRGHLFRRQAPQPDQGPAAPRQESADGIRQGRRAAGNPLCEQAAHRHLQAGEHGGKNARHHRIAGRGNPLPEPGGRSRNRQRPGARRGARQRRAHRRPIMSSWRSATARATPSRCSTTGGFISRPSPFPSAFASSTRSR